MDADEFMDSSFASQGPSHLEFSETLLGNNKALKVADLVALLKKLHVKLKDLDQNVDQDSLSTVTKELVNKQLLKNTNKTVKALTACCLADIIRLHAPNCPYEPNVLKETFKFFISQLSNFGSDSPDFEYYFYLLENLQSVKTFLLLSELKDFDIIVIPLFEEFLKVAESGTLARNVELCMTDVLIQLIEEVGALSSEVTELLLEQFDKNEKGSDNPAYLMTLDICYACPTILQRRVCQHFSDVLLSVSNTSESTSSDEDLEEVKKTHQLIRKIHAVTPDLLLNVLPLLQEEMKVNHFNVRQLATDTMGQMFAEQSSTVAEKYPAIYKTWLGRRDDKAVQLRIKWLEMCVDILKNHIELAPELLQCVKSKLCDPDEKVRSTACKVIKDMEMAGELADLDKSLLEAVAERTKDKKNSVRTEAMETLGSVYMNCFDKLVSGDKMAASKIGWIPDRLFDLLYLGDAAVTVSLEKALLEYILPENDDDTGRTERLVAVVESLGEKQRLAFTALIRKQKLFNENMQTYWKMCEDHLKETSRSEHDITKTDEFMKYLAGFFADKARTLNALRSFMNRNSDRDLKILKKAIDLNFDYKHICVAKKKLLSNLNDDESAIFEIFQAILNRACPVILNKSNIKPLLKLSKATVGRKRMQTEEAIIAQEILNEISTTFPAMYKSCMPDVIKEIMDDNDNSSEEGLKLLSEISKASPGKMVYKEEVKDRLMDFVNNGSATQTEYAAIALGNMKNADVVLTNISSVLIDMLKLNDPRLLCTLTSLSQFALYTKDVITPSIELIIRFVEKDLLQTRTENPGKLNSEWEPFEDLPELSQQKLIGARLLVNYLIACKEDVDPEQYVIDHIFKVIWDMFDRTCEDAIADGTNAAETSHFRLASSQAIVKLTQYVKYMDELTVTKFEKLSLTLQDTCFFVRSEFTQSLMKGLQTEQIHSRYYALLFICVHEPEAGLLKQVKTFIQTRLSNLVVKSGESSVLDSSLVRLIHLLAHHPDFSIAVEDLEMFTAYIQFFLNCVATSDNVSFLYHVSQKIKMSKDMVAEELSQNSYLLSDLACLLIKNKCKDNTWPLNAYEGYISLQSRLYRSLPSGTIQAETIKKSYLPSAFIAKFEEKQNHKSGEKRSRASTSTVSKRAKT